jgi:hypothetical protein
VVESDGMVAVGDWKLKVDVEETFSMEWMNRMAVATDDIVTAPVVCFATLKDKTVNQIKNAVGFEEIKAWRKDKKKMEKLMDVTAGSVDR